MKKDLSSPYENMLMHLFLNNHIDFFFTKKNKDNSYLNNTELDMLLKNCIHSEDAFKELLSNFQWNSDIKFTETFLKENKIALSVKKQYPDFLSFKNHQDLSYHLTSDFYKELPEMVQNFLRGKMINAIKFRKGEHSQFKIEHLEKESLGNYYLFSLLVLQKEEHNENFQKAFFNQILDINNSGSMIKTFDFLKFLNNILYPHEPDYLFMKNLNPQIVKNIIIMYNIGYSNLESPIFSLSKNAIETFYEMYFSDISEDKLFSIEAFLNKKNTPDYIKEKYKDKITISSDDLPTIDMKPIQSDNLITISYNISFKIKDIEKLYSKYFYSYNLSHIFDYINAETAYNNDKIKLKGRINKNILNITIDYHIYDKNNFNKVYDFSENYQILVNNFIRSIVQYKFEKLSNPNIKNIETDNSILEKCIQKLRSDLLISNLNLSNQQLNKPRSKI